MCVNVYVWPSAKSIAHQAVNIYYFTLAVDDAIYGSVAPAVIVVVCTFQSRLSLPTCIQLCRLLHQHTGYKTGGRFGVSTEGKGKYGVYAAPAGKMSLYLIFFKISEQAIFIWSLKKVFRFSIILKNWKKWASWTFFLADGSHVQLLSLIFFYYALCAEVE